MTADKTTSDFPTVVVAEIQASEKKSHSHNKYVIIAVSVIFAVGIVLTPILVGMYIFTEAQKEIIKYSLSMGGNSRQDVTIDPNENIVQYYVLTSNQETWIENDFNRDIQVMKIMVDGKTICFMVPLNKTKSVRPSDITGKETGDVTARITLSYQASDTPVTDQPFLSKSAQILCNGVSTYWLYPTHKNKSNNNDLNFRRQAGSKVKYYDKGDIVNYNLKIRSNEVHTRVKRQTCCVCNLSPCSCLCNTSPCSCDCRAAFCACICTNATSARKKRFNKDEFVKYDETTWGYGAPSTTKREAPPNDDGSPYYYKKWAEYCESGSCYWVPCVMGCCEEICACEIDYFAYIQNGRMYCQWVTKSCPTKISYDPLYYQCVDGPNGMSCPNDPYPHNPPCT